MVPIFRGQARRTRRQDQGHYAADLFRSLIDILSPPLQRETLSVVNSGQTAYLTGFQRECCYRKATMVGYNERALVRAASLFAHLELQATARRICLSCDKSGADAPSPADRRASGTAGSRREPV